jgi:hypothetical protein
VQNQFMGALSATSRISLPRPFAALSIALASRLIRRKESGIDHNQRQWGPPGVSGATGNDGVTGAPGAAGATGAHGAAAGEHRTT